MSDRLKMTYQLDPFFSLKESLKVNELESAALILFSKTKPE